MPKVHISSEPFTVSRYHSYVPSGDNLLLEKTKDSVQTVSCRVVYTDPCFRAVHDLVYLGKMCHPWSLSIVYGVTRGHAAHRFLLLVLDAF